IIHHGPNNLDFISGGFGLTRIFELDQEKRENFLTQFEYLMKIYNIIIINMRSEVIEKSMYFILDSVECNVITTDKPTAITEEYIVLKTPEQTANTDEYGMIKHVVNNAPSKPIYVVMNRSETKKSRNTGFATIPTGLPKIFKKRNSFNW